MYSRSLSTMMKLLVLLAILQFAASEKTLKRYFDRLNNETKNFNALGAEISWDLSLEPNDVKLYMKADELQQKYLEWQQETCNKLEVVQFTTVLNKTQERMIYLLCRGPKYTLEETKEAHKLLVQLEHNYADSDICLPYSKTAKHDNLTSIEAVIMSHLSYTRWEWYRNKMFLLNNEDKFPPDSGSYCMRGETDFNRLMSFSRNKEILNWVWETWRYVMADMKEPYQKLVNLQNRAAQRSGYVSIGEVWRKEMEIPNILELCEELYRNVTPLYKLLHGVTRYFLRREYGLMVPVQGPIPAFLLGDLWAQNWEPLADLILPKTIDLDKEMREGKVKWDINHMLSRTEDFYMSLGLPAMTEAFWRESVFSRANHSAARCHGTAADMFKDGDFRMIYCADVTFQDFKILHHEMGHIQYFMAYEKQPGIFRQANAALHESIGDTVMYGAMTPQHLHRLGLVNDSVLYSKPEIKTEKILCNVNDVIKELIEEDYESEERTVTPVDYMLGDMPDSRRTELEITADDILLLKQGLSKIPQIPFALAMDVYRWEYFENKIDKGQQNTAFWSLMEKMQGVAPLQKRGDGYIFDLGAKFHVPDNTPFIRYFLSSFIQHQLFESLCKASVYGRRNVKEPIPDSILLHRCDIYGSKSAGKLLRDIMSRGHSQPIQEILKATTGNPDISSAALERYYRPLKEMLHRLVIKYRIPLGW